MTFFWLALALLATLLSGLLVGHVLTGETARKEGYQAGFLDGERAANQRPRDGKGRYQPLHGPRTDKA